MLDPRSPEDKAFHSTLFLQNIDYFGHFVLSTQKLNLIRKESQTFNARLHDRKIGCGPVEKVVQTA